MNRWGQLAIEHWSQYLPDRFEKIALSGAPESYFEALGTEVATEIEVLYEAMLANQPAGLTPDQATGWRAMARHNAESQVLTEMVLLEPEADEDDREDPTSALSVIDASRQAILDSEMDDD